MNTEMETALIKMPFVFAGRTLFIRLPVMQGFIISFIFVTCPGKTAQLFQSTSNGVASIQETSQRKEQTAIWMIVGEQRFAITLEDNEASRQFAAMMPVSISMSDLNSNEKYAELSQPLPVNTYHPGIIQNGDLMVYGNRTLVVFYKTFHSSYSYTHLGRVDDPPGLEQAMGNGNVRITFLAQ